MTVDPGTIRQVTTIRAKLEVAMNWMIGLGLRPSPWMQKALDSFQTLARVADMPHDEIVARLPELTESLYLRQEAADFIRIHECFATPEDEEVVRQKLKHAQTGSDSVLDEVDVGHGRNYIAELSWAALLRHAGYTTVLGYPTDVLVPMKILIGSPPVAYAIEVKRPNAGIASSVKDGAGQVQEAVEGGRNPGFPYQVVGGIVVLVVDRLIDRDGDADFSRVRSVEDTKARQHARIGRFANENMDDLDAGRVRPGVHGVRMWWRSICLTPHPRNPGHGLWTDFSQQYLHRYKTDEWAFNLYEMLEKAKTW